MAILKISYLLFLVLGCGYAAAKGGRPERWGAAIVAVGMVLSNVAGFRSGHVHIAVDPMLVAVDVTMAIALIVLAVKSDRFWPLWVAMLQLDAVFTHVVMLAHSTPPFSYGLALWMFGLPLPVLVGLGTLRYRVREIGAAHRAT